MDGFVVLALDHHLAEPHLLPVKPLPVDSVHKIGLPIFEGLFSFIDPEEVVYTPFEEVVHIMELRFILFCVECEIEI